VQVERAALVARDDRGGKAVVFAATMDRRLAKKNIRTGLIVAAICMFMFALTFVVAAVYVS
jgi:hypothetical protein